MEKRLFITSLAVFAGVLLAGLVMAKPGIFGDLDPTPAVAGTTRSLLGSGDDDDRQYEEDDADDADDEGEREDREHDDEGEDEHEDDD